MKWQEIRDRYPQQWLLIEAIKAHTEHDKRVLDQIAVLGAYSNSTTALQGYQQLHQEDPERELYVFHTSRTELDITERHWIGIRGAA
jgi:hypothetical protein